MWVHSCIRAALNHVGIFCFFPLSYAQAQTYQFFSVKVPRANMGNKVVRISLDAIEGDPDLFACIDEFPSSERNTWKSAGEGDDKIEIPPPHACSVYYIGVFGYYYSQFKIVVHLVDEQQTKRDRSMNQREALLESVQVCCTTLDEQCSNFGVH